MHARLGDVFLLFFWGVLQIVYTKDTRIDFDENRSKDAVLHKDVPFGGRKTKI